MRLHFLGTAGSEGYPNAFCDCENCRQARALGGRAHRLRSALLVNDDLLIDLGPDLGASAQRSRLSLARVATLLVTHRHADHLDVEWLAMRVPEQTAVPPAWLTLYGPADVLQLVTAGVDDLERIRVDLAEVSPHASWDAGGYHVNCLAANHGGGKMQAHVYAVGDGQRRFLYATDSAELPEETWAALSDQRLDCLIMEETLGHGERAGHLNIQSFLDQAARFRRSGILRDGAPIFATHISHMYNPPHEELSKLLAPYDVITAYDGLDITI